MLARTGKDGFNIVVEGICRFKVGDFIQHDPFFLAKMPLPINRREFSPVESILWPELNLVLYLHS